MSPEIVGRNRQGKPLALRAGNKYEGNRGIPYENGVPQKRHGAVPLLEEGFPPNQKQKLNIPLGFHRNGTSERGSRDFAVNERSHGALRRPNGKGEGLALGNGTDLRIEAVART